MISRRTAFLSCCLFPLVCFASVVSAADPVRLLFAGSSSTYWNDLPAEVAQLVAGKVHGAEGRPIDVEIVGRSGDDIRVYSEPGFDRYQYGVKEGQTFLEKVRDESFDLVSLMVVCRFITADGERWDDSRHAQAVSQYCSAIRAAGGEPIFYEMGWGRGEQEELGRERILQLALANKVRYFAPCSSAWARVYRERPGLALQHPRDASHPGNFGHFLNLACFYAALTRTSPVGKLPRDFHVWPHLSKEEKEAKKEQLDAAFAKFEPNDYQARLPEWMRRNAGAGYRAQIDEQTAQYLETVAWKTWNEVQAKLEGQD